MKIKIISTVAVFLLVSAIVGCDKLGLGVQKKPTATLKAQKEVPVVKGTLIARVNNTPLTLEELNKEVEAFNTIVPEDQPQARITTRDQKIDYLKNEMTRRLLMNQEALVRGLDKKDEVVQALEKTKQDLLVMELVRQEAERVDVTSQEVEEYYNGFKDQLKEPEERQLREIIVLSEPEAKEVLIQLLQGADFANLARERSKAANAKDGGDLGYIQPGKKSAQFDAVAFSDTLEVGKTSNIFKGPEGYYILKLEGKKGGKQRSLTEMWDDIKRGLTYLKQQKKINDLIDKLSREAKLEYYEGDIR
ncbi:MAG: peptidyl-prolyl cis-trans isomerase [Candidatus Omnitrophota bacterium]